MPATPTDSSSRRMMMPVSRNRSLSDLDNIEVPEELDDTEYVKEVLRLASVETEDAFDNRLVEEAAGLGITVSRPSTATKNGHISQCESSLTVETRHTRSGSTASQSSDSTSMTSRSSNEQIGYDSHGASTRKPAPRRSLSFSEYDKYLEQVAIQKVAGRLPPPPIPIEPSPSLFSVSTRMSYASIKSGLKSRLRIRRRSGAGHLKTCICCRDEFKKNQTMHTMPCLHNYCDNCLHTLVTQAAADETNMPPKCCSQPVSAPMIKNILSPEEQQDFMRSVIQYATPWDARIFCPNPACGQFIPKRNKIDPKHPFEVVCRKCRTKACSTCKRGAHPIGQDCPADWELDAVLKMGENHGWRRCYKCRTLVELSQGCSHITCRCKAQFCYICGAVWDPDVGCPNYCDGEEELERRRAEEEARAAKDAEEKAAQEAADAIMAAEMVEAIKRSQEHDELNALRARQINEQDRFCAFERKMKWLMWTRHGQAKLDTLDRYAELHMKMKERHQKTSSHLEDRQVAAEMELRASLKQSERSVRIRLRHMEAYCDGLGRSASGMNPARIVTERDLRELGQQYNLRDDLERMHQSKINVMRDKQAKQMEQLISRQEEELEKLVVKQQDDLDALEEGFGVEEEQFLRLFTARKHRLLKRWGVVEQIARKRLEEKDGVMYGPLPAIEWVAPTPANDVVLEAVTE